VTKGNELTYTDEWNVLKNVVMLACIPPTKHERILKFFHYLFNKISWSYNTVEHHSGWALIHWVMIEIVNNIEY
jgi:hypothetical protein